MKKLTLVSGLIVLFAGILIYGCKKESLDPGTQPGSSINITSSTISSSYSWVGELHNKCLEEIGELNDFPDVTAQQVDSTIKVTIENSPHVVDSLNSSAMADARDDLDYVWSTPYNTIINDLEDSGYVENDVAEKLVVIRSIVESSSSLNNAIDSLKSFEVDIENASVFTEDEKTGIILASITARYSMNFWNDAHSNPENNWYAVVESEGNGGGDYYSGFIKRTFKDVVGWVKGFFRNEGSKGRGNSARFRSSLSSSNL